jgi:hypothetical protein
MLVTKFVANTCSCTFFLSIQFGEGQPIQSIHQAIQLLTSLDHPIQHFSLSALLVLMRNCHSHWWSTLTNFTLIFKLPSCCLSSLLTLVAVLSHNMQPPRPMCCLLHIVCVVTISWSSYYCLDYNLQKLKCGLSLLKANLTIPDEWSNQINLELLFYCVPLWSFIPESCSHYHQAHDLHIGLLLYCSYTKYPTPLLL